MPRSRLDRRSAIASLVLVLLSVTAAAWPVKYQPNTSPGRNHVVVVAHQDDWQLFMGDALASQVRAGDSATFVYLTAGDDGRDSLYWQTRERAALESTRLLIGPSAADSAIRCTVEKVVDHPIRRCVLANSTSFFLRLPDGKRNGAGFVTHAHQSLRKLRGKRIAVIDAIDGSTSFQGWADLVATVKALVGSNDAIVHTSDPSIAVNPHDHFDHRMAGLLIADARTKGGWDTRYYVGYALATRAANRSTDQARKKTAIFLRYEREMTRANKDWSAYREHPGFYSQCMVRTYARQVPASRNR